MLDPLPTLPADPILGLIDAHDRDPNPHKVDLGAGVYRDRDGRTPVLAAVRTAEARLLSRQDTKSYVTPPGVPGFLRDVPRLLLGESHPALAEGRVAAVQTPGGSGALRLGAELTRRADPEVAGWVSTPTWVNHFALLGESGLPLHAYPYYDPAAHALDFDAMAAALAQRGQGDLVILHGSCHNPCGADLSAAQWDAVCELAAERRFTPFVDMAYHGLGEGQDADAYGVRLLASRLPEVLVAYSCSKTFGLYRERAGLVLAIAANPATATAAGTQLNAIARGMYSMPPAHGPAIVAEILADEELTAAWVEELAAMRDRINGIRALAARELTASAAGDFRFLARERGMFSFLGVTPDQARALRDEHSVYLMDSGRINVAGLTEDNVELFVKAVTAVLA